MAQPSIMAVSDTATIGLTLDRAALHETSEGANRLSPGRSGFPFQASNQRTFFPLFSWLSWRTVFQGAVLLARAVSQRIVPIQSNRDERQPTASQTQESIQEIAPKTPASNTDPEAAGSSQVGPLEDCLFPSLQDNCEVIDRGVIGAGAAANEKAGRKKAGCKKTRHRSGRFAAKGVTGGHALMWHPLRRAGGQSRWSGLRKFPSEIGFVRSPLWICHFRISRSRRFSVWLADFGAPADFGPR